MIAGRADPDQHRLPLLGFSIDRAPKTSKGDSTISTDPTEPSLPMRLTSILLLSIAGIVVVVVVVVVIATHSAM
jgi:hypothetical protein